MGDEETMDESRRMKEKDGSKKLEARSQMPRSEVGDLRAE